VAFVQFVAIPLKRYGHQTGAFLSKMIVGAALYVSFSLELGPNAGLDIRAPAWWRCCHSLPSGSSAASGWASSR